MDNTASFSSRGNAKRAAEKMIANATAPSVDYGLKPRDDGRFEIVWKIANEPATDQLETEIAAAAAPDQWFPGTEGTHFAGQALQGPAAAADTGESSGAANDPAEAELAATAPAPRPVTAAPAEPDPELAEAYIYEVETERLIAELTRRGYRVTQARQRRTAPASAPRKRSRSRYGIDPAAIAAGTLPDSAPVVTSGQNQLYQKKFDALHAHAVAGEWQAVRDYKVTGSNSYSKLVARYREDLLAVHAAQTSPKQEMAQ